MPITILLADAQRMMSDALRRTLNTYSELKTFDVLPASGHELLAAAEDLQPDVVLIDYWLPGMDPLAAVRLILTRLPNCKIILMSWLPAVQHAHRVLRAGAAGFLSKSLTVDELAEAVKKAAAGEVPVFERDLDQMITKLTQRAYHDEKVWEGLSLLTAREIQIMKLLDQGRLIGQVAKDLGIKPSTVRNHIHNILEKTGAQSHLQALAMARHHGLIQS